jgi:hypothetical protein
MKEKVKIVTRCTGLTREVKGERPGSTGCLPAQRVASAARRKSRRRLYLLLHYRLVPPPPAGLAGVRRSGEPNLYVKVLVKVVFSSRLN